MAESAFAEIYAEIVTRAISDQKLLSDVVDVSENRKVALVGQYSKQIEVLRFEAIFTRYSTYPLKGMRYNATANDWEYELRIPMKSVTPLPKQRATTKDKKYEWKVLVTDLSLRYLVNQKICYYSCSYQVIFRKAQVATIQLEETFQPWNAHNDLNSQLVSDKSQKIVVNSKNHEIPGRLYEIEALEPPGAPITYRSLNYFTCPSLKLSIKIRGQSEIRQAQLFVYPRLSAKTLHVPQSHPLNIKFLNPPQSPDFAHAGIVIKAGTTTNFWNRKGEPLVPLENRWDKNISDIYFYGSFRELTLGKPTTEQMQRKFTKEASARIRVRSLPRSRVYIVEYGIPPPKKLIEDWNSVGKFTLWQFDAIIDAKQIGERLDRFGSEVVEKLPLTGQFIGRESNNELFELIDRARPRVAFQSMVKNILEHWKTHYTKTTDLLSKGYVNAALEVIWSEVGHILEPTPTLCAYLMKKYFDFSSRSEIPEYKYYYLQNGTYLRKWERTQLQDKELMENKDILHTVESDLNEVEFDYFYRYVPPQNPTIVSIVSDGKEQDLELKLTPNHVYPCILLDYIEPDGTKSRTIIHPLPPSGKIQISSPSKNTYVVKVDVVARTLIAPHTRISVINRVRLSHRETRYFHIESIQDLVLANKQ